MSILTTKMRGFRWQLTDNARRGFIAAKHPSNAIGWHFPQIPLMTGPKQQAILDWFNRNATIKINLWGGVFWNVHSHEN